MKNVAHKISKVFFLILLLPQFATAKEPSWSEWERNNSVAQYHDWLVILQEDEDFCYMKQSYYDSPEMMVMILKKNGIPTIITPFYKGVDGSVLYRIDRSPSSRAYGAGGSVVTLPEAVLPKLIRGQTLFVTAKPVGEQTREQSFSLSGFSAAFKRLESKKCNPPAKPERNMPIQVSLTRRGASGTSVTGTTNLPDGMELMITLSNENTDYRAQSKATVRKGDVTAGSFSDRGSRLPPGKYAIAISSPMGSLQPRSVQAIVGDIRVDMKVYRDLD